MQLDDKSSSVRSTSDSHRAALVLFSGGQDSTTCLAWALEQFEYVETIGYDYGQRHSVELSVRPSILSELRKEFPSWSHRLGNDAVVHLDLAGVSTSALLDEHTCIGKRDDGLPNTFVPGRNLLFLLYASIILEQKGLKHLVIGACETDYSGYPDCRNDAIMALQVAANLGLQTSLVFHTPLMWLTKAETWALAQRLGGDQLVRIILEQSHTCYEGDRTHRNDWGYGCAACDACKLRAEGWTHFIADRQERQTQRA